MEFNILKAEKFCDSVKDGTHDSPKKANKGYKLITSKHIREYDLDLNNAYYISEEDFNKINQRSLVEKNDILYSMIGTIGLIYRVKENPDYAIKNIGLFKLKDELKSKWLYYYLKTPKMKKYIESLLSGSTQQYITLKNLRELPIEVPVNIENMKKIVKILENIKKKIELNNKINNNLQEIINLIFKKWFIEFEFPILDGKCYKSSNGIMKNSELGEIPENWKVIKLENIIDFSNGYSIDSKKMLDKEEKNTYKVFKMGNIKPLGGINKDKTKSWLSKEYCTGLEKYISKKGDILMCMTDMKNSDTPLLGHTALIDKNNEFIINQRVGILRCKKELVNYPFVYTLTNLDFFVKDIRSRANSGVQVNLSTKGICETPLIFPDKKTLDEFNNITEPIYEKIFKNNDENETLSKLRDNLLPKLMNGEIDLENIEI